MTKNKDFVILSILSISGSVFDADSNAANRMSLTFQNEIPRNFFLKNSKKFPKKLAADVLSSYEVITHIF